MEDDKVVQSLAKADIEFTRFGHDKTSRRVGGFAMYLHANEEVEGLLVTSDMKGSQEVDSFMLGLPGVNKNNIVAMMESGMVHSLDVWRRQD